MNWINPPEDISPYQGFVYEIVETSSGKRYIGKKAFWKVIRRKPLKGFKRNRLSKVETDWKVYLSSNEEIKEKLLANPFNYERKIIKLCKSKIDMAVWETQLQLEYYVKGDWDKLFNEVINLRVRIRKGEKK